ncbi:ABC transporter substrate-binding protein [Sphingomonas sp. TF3]|uniref:ABC transporter substrate-binding protein n=1 Tax=Sphingomonas sp. TF3 TaxID=2495580 RepID=UPI00163CF5FA|nr:ABC transporter substrate-binding protein [Sphingomonas sp. TF3]
MLLGGAAVALLTGQWGRSTAPLSIRVASNQGVENATLQQLMVTRGFGARLALDIATVDSLDIAGPIAALEAGTADLCMISAYAGVLPAIAEGRPIRLIGSAMRVPALAVCSADPTLRDVRALRGRRIGIGEQNGLLHLVMIALLHRHGMTPDDVRFVSVGSNAQVFKAVLSGAVDAGAYGVADLSDTRAHMLAGGALWQALPQFPYQLAYASRDALCTRRDAIARCLAAYALLFRFVSEPSSRDAYLAARAAVGGDRVEGDQVWRFIHRTQPYAREPGLSAGQIGYLQRLNVAAGVQRRILSFDQVADLAPAMEARRLLERTRHRGASA